MSDAELTTWLLEGDPAIVWQVQRDLLGRKPSTWQASRRRVAKEGWAARLLEFRAPDGSWGGGLYSPKWTSTFYTMRLLQHLGLPSTELRGRESCSLLLDRGVTSSGAVSLWKAPWVDTCVTAMLLSMACAFDLEGDERCHRMATWLLEEQMLDGGWNCERYRGATHSSIHTTLSVLEALAAFEVPRSMCKRASRAVKEGQEFLLEHQLYRSSTTGAVIKHALTKFAFPIRWQMDVLRGLEYFSDIGASWDERLADPVRVLESKRRRDGRFGPAYRHTGRSYFALEEPRSPSRMNTFRVLKVRRWLDGVR